MKISKISKISVVLPYYDGGRYIKEQLDSILPQLKKDDEVIISIDRAADGSMELLKQYEQRDKRVILIKGPKKGVVKNVECAVSAASGDVIFLSDQDDVWTKEKVKKVMDAFQKPNTVAVLHNAEIVDGHLKKLGQTTFEWRKSKTGKWKNFLKNSYIGACMAFRSDLKSIIFPIPDKIFMHDYWIGVRAEELGKVVLIEEPLLLYRRHESNVTALKHESVFFMLRKRFYIVTETIKWKWNSKRKQKIRKQETKKEKIKEEKIKEKEKRNRK